MNRHVTREIDWARNHIEEWGPIEEWRSHRFVANRVYFYQNDVSRIWNRYLGTNSLRDRPWIRRRRTNQNEE